MKDLVFPTISELVEEAQTIGADIEKALQGENKTMKGCSTRSEVVKRREIAYELELMGTPKALIEAERIRTQNRVYLKTMEAY